MIIEVYDKVSDLWNKYGFELLIIFSIIIIILTSLFRLLFSKNGTWSKYLSIPSYLLTPANLSTGRFSPQKISKGESECKRVLEKLYKVPFNKARPSFLRNPVTGNHNLELDCFNENLKIACEYQGIQHYKFTPYFHKNIEAFRNQQYRDELKKRICASNGIFLITVPYTVKTQDIENYIRSQFIPPIKKQILL